LGIGWDHFKIRIQAIAPAAAGTTIRVSYANYLNAGFSRSNSTQSQLRQVL
jgi:hypothetical protein